MNVAMPNKMLGTMHSVNAKERGAGVLVVHVSTIGAADESSWASTERRLPGPSFLHVRARFGPGSAVVSAPWTTGPDVGSGQLRRDVKLHLPYFNLADGSRSTDAALLVEVVVLKRASEHGRSVTRPDGDEYSERQMTEVCQQGRREATSQLDSSKTLAVARLDVQTALIVDLSRSSGAMSTTLSTEKNVVFNVAKTKSASGTAHRSCPELPDSIPVSVKLSFSKPVSNATAVDEQRVEPKIQGAGHENDVPAFFVVATTLFDCARILKEAELRVYIRNGDTGKASHLSSGGRGEIVVHESFEWNVSADLSTLFAYARETPYARHGATLIIALVDKAVTINEGYITRKGRRRDVIHDTEEIAVGVLELSCEELMSCGPAGRWRPLRACLSSTHQGRHGCVGPDIVGEALVAFAWMPRGPETNALPKGSADQRLCWSRKRRRQKNKTTESNRDSQADPSRNCAKEDTQSSIDADVHGSLVEPGTTSSSGSNCDSTRHDTLVHFHVWDALLPLERPDSAFYFTVRLSCRGSRVQRTSTKPARGRGGLRKSTTAAGGNGSCYQDENTSGERRSRAGSMHVVWDEHLLLRVKGPVEEGAVVELVLRDASVDDETTHACREGEAFQEFADSLGLGRAEVTATSASPCSSTSFDQLQIPSPVVYRLKLQHPSGMPEGGTYSSASTNKKESTARNGEGFGRVEVRMAGLVICQDGSNADGDEDRVEAFLRRKADVARIPGGVKRRLSTVGGESGTVCFSPALLPAQGIGGRRRRCRLLDLPAANGLFHRFAEGGTGGTCAVEINNTGWSPRVEAGGNTSQSSGIAGVDLMERYQFSSESILTDGGLGQVIQQYFPRLAQRASEDDLDVASAIPQQSTARCPQPAATAKQASSGMSFTGFVSWLRNLPQDDLGTAGLLVSPRTALRKTGRTMDEDTQGLAAALQLAREPTAMLISMPLTSTTDALALDRVRIGWGRMGGGDEIKREGGAEESEWRRHAELLQRDVTLLRKAVAELEQTRGWCDEPTVGTERADTRTSILDHGMSEDCGVDADANRATRGNEQVKKHDHLPPTGEKGAAAACGDRTTAVERQKPQCCSVAALYVGQEAVRLGSAAEHLKEALRCAGDTLTRSSAHTPHRQGAGGRFSRAQTDLGKEFSAGSSQTLLEAIIRTNAPGDGEACYHHRCYGLLLQHIKQITAFQTEIAALQRRAAAIAQRTEGKANPQTASWCGQCWCGYSVSCDKELPRSALALVKRIRGAQNAARRQQTPESRSSACDAPVTGGVTLLPMSHKQCNGDGLPSSTILDNRDSLGEGAESKEKMLQQNRVSSPPPCRAPAAAFAAHVDGCASAPALASPRAPFIDMLRGPTLLQKIEGRLENIRSVFYEKGIDVSAAFSTTTAERVLEIARGVGQETGLAPLAALCCPIDRFALHVFRTAGAAEKGGSAVFTSVQELAGMGGLEIYATEQSLWTAAAQAGIVDVDRWVVAAVLWQVTEAAVAANARDVGSPNISCQGSMGAAAGEGLEGVSSDKHAVVLTEARSLWKELREEAFLLVLGRSSGDYDQGTTPIAELGTSSAAFSTPLSTPGGQAQWKKRLDLAGEAREDGKDTEQTPRQRYNALQSDATYFDVVLMRTLAQAGRGDAGPGLAAATEASVGTRSGSLDSGGSSLECVENILLHNFAIAGFADGSRLDVSDIVDAVSVRRQRVLSAAAAPASTAAADDRCPSRGIAEKDDDNLLRSTKNQDHAEGPLQLGGVFQDDRQGSLSTELPTGETASTGQAIPRGAYIGEGDGSESADDTAVGVPMESNLEARILAGIPAELRELFRTAALAKMVRQQQQQQREQSGQKEVHQGENAESDELTAAEQKVTRVLDSNRTLESAPFSEGRTALHHAAARGDAFLVRVLLERGCQPHLKDFEGKRACDLTRDLKCLRLLGALKKAPEPSAISLRASTPGESATVLSGDAGGGTLGPPRRSARAMTTVEFAVSFRLGKEEAAEQSLGGAVKSPSGSPHASELEQGRHGGADVGAIGAAVWVEGVARSYDVRNKTLFIDANDRENVNPGTEGAATGPTTDCSGKAETGRAATPARNQPADEEQHGRSRAEGGQRRHSYARHILDVRLLSCLSSQGEELFDQLRAFSCAFKTGLARASLDVAIDAAADLGAVCRVVLSEFVSEIVREDVATEACRHERLTVAANSTAKDAVGSALRAAQRAVILAQQFASRGAAYRRKTTMVNYTGTGGERQERARTPTSTTGVENSSPHVAGASGGESSPGHPTVVVDKNAAARLCFRCTTIVTEKRRKFSRAAVASAADVGRVVDRKGHDLQYLARWTIEGGLATVVVHGSSYLNAVAAEKRGGGGCRPINLEGRDAGVERVLKSHGVSLSACLQTFDVMQDMDDPSIVLDMLAAGICQLSTRYAEEGIEFSSLCQSDQDALQADVRSQLYHPTGHGAGAAPEWDELSITMQAYGGVTSVVVVRNGGNGKTSNGGKILVVPAPTAGGWFSPQEAAAALTSPPSPQKTASSPPAPSPPEPLPPSAVNAALALMRCNPCEVLGSLSPGIGVDGRIALVGQVNNGGPGPTGGNGVSGEHRGGESLLRKRRHRDGRETAIRREDRVDGGTTTKGVRCSVEVAWDKDEGGVFVQRFGMEPDERRPRFNLRAVGIRGFSVTQLPVTLEDIDEVWDQAGSDSASNSGASAVSDRPRGSTSSSSDSGRSSEGGRGGGGGKLSPEQAPVSTAKSAKADMSAVEGASLTASEAAAHVAVTASGKISQGVEEACEVDSGSSGSEENDGPSEENPDLIRAAAAAKTAADCANPEPSSDVESSSEDRYESDGPALVQDETNVKGEKHADLEATTTSEELVSNSSKDNVPVGGVGEGRTGKQKEEECEIDQETDGCLEAESVEGGNGEELTIKQDRKDGLAGSAVDATERAAPAVEDDDGEVLHREPSEGRAVAEMDQDSDVSTAFTAAEREDDSGAAEKRVTTSPSEDGEELTIKQDRKDGLAGSAVDATERAAPAVEDDDGEVLHREPSEGRAVAEMDQDSDVSTGFTAAEREDDSGAAEKRVTTSPSEDGEELTIKQDRKDGLAGSAVDATERAAPAVEDDDGEVLHREPSEGRAVAEMDQDSDVSTAFTAAEREDDSGTAEKRVTTSPSEDGEELTIKQDRKDGLAGSAVDATERAAPAVEDDDGEVLHREPSEGRAVAEMDQDNDVSTGFTAAECVGDSGTAEKRVTTSPSEDVDLDTVFAPDPDEEAMKHPQVDTPEGMLVEDGNDDMGASPSQRENRASPTLVDRTQTASAASQATPQVAGESGQENADAQGTNNAGNNADLSHSQVLDDEKAPEKETRERNRQVESQVVLGHAPGGVGSEGADKDSVDMSPAETEAASLSRDGGVAEDTTDEKIAPLVSSSLWKFPPSFQALVALSTANDVVECTLEGEIAPEQKGDSLDNGAPSWKSVHCLYRIAAGSSHPSPQAAIDLEDDEAQARLEDLLERAYGLAMEDVLERFSPDTDLGSGEAVVRSFTDSICQLRPSLLAQPQNARGEERPVDGDHAVHEAVGAALRGGGERLEWREMQVRVGESRVLEVGITANTSSTSNEPRGRSTESDDDNKNSVVDCSSVGSPLALRPHLLSGGLPMSAVDALERAGFVGAKSVVDLAGVLAALAQEAEKRKSVVAQSPAAIPKDEGERNWPGVDPDRDRTQLLRLASERRSGDLAAPRDYKVAVTGTSERFKLEISPVLAGDDVPPDSVVLTTISCLRPLGTSPVATENGRRSETPDNDETGNSSARTPQPEDASSRIVGSREADTVGLNIGDRVEARFGGKTEWFPGTVTAVNAVHEKYASVGGTGIGDSGGTLRSNLPMIAIDYDDGDVEERVPRVRVRLPGQKQPRCLNEGDEVDVKRGKRISLARVVVRPSSPAKEEGHYDLQLLNDGRRGVGGAGAFVENCPRSAMMALHSWPPARK